jgi:recombinational DNA repair ATPase RecF
LLDDVDAELDRKRINQLLEYLEGRTQTFVTTSKESLVEQYGARAQIYEVRDGAANLTSTPESQISTSSKGASSI